MQDGRQVGDTDASEVGDDSGRAMCGKPSYVLGAADQADDLVSGFGELLGDVGAGPAVAAGHDDLQRPVRDATDGGVDGAGGGALVTGACCSRRRPRWSAL